MNYLSRIVVAIIAMTLMLMMRNGQCSGNVGRSHVQRPFSAAGAASNIGPISPLVFQKYNLTPASSIVGTSVAPTEQLFNYVPAPIAIAASNPHHHHHHHSSKSSLLTPDSSSALPIMTALKSLSHQARTVASSPAALMAAAQAAVPISLNAALSGASSNIPVTYK